MKLRLLEKQLGYQFEDLRRLELALSHRSVGSFNNERLEFLGDSILGFVIAERLFELFPDQKEGQLSRFRSQLVKRETLAEVARAIDLGDYLILGPGELRSGGQNRDSILADAIEAVIAAVYLDDGIKTAKSLILRLLESQLEALDATKVEKDPKTALQEHLQSLRKNLPRYEVVSVAGEHHSQSFTVDCIVEDLQRSATGTGTSRRAAEQQAAKQLLEALQ